MGGLPHCPCRVNTKKIGIVGTVSPLAPCRRAHRPFLFIGSRLCSTLLSDPASRRCPCSSLLLHPHQVVKRTFTSSCRTCSAPIKQPRPQTAPQPHHTP